MPTGEYARIEDQNHRIAVNITQEGYVLVVQADGNTRSGVLGGNMLLALQKNRKAAGLVVHGVIRDYAEAATQDFPIWTQDAKTTTDYDAQHDIAPLAVNGRISVAGNTVMPGDWIRADDDGVCFFPGDRIEEVLDGCNKHWWEPAARHYLSDGGHLDDCYPLPERRYSEAAAWQRANGHYVPEDIG
jgi:regulator of RNase E activity RraA